MRDLSMSYQLIPKDFLKANKEAAVNSGESGNLAQDLHRIQTPIEDNPCIAHDKQKY
jgi:hypothetical protein